MSKKFTNALFILFLLTSMSSCLKFSKNTSSNLSTTHNTNTETNTSSSSGLKSNTFTIPLSYKPIDPQVKGELLSSLSQQSSTDLITITQNSFLHLSKDDQKIQTDTAPIYWRPITSYYVHVFVGTPLQQIEALFDTGSSYSMVLTKDCFKPENGCQGDSTYFDTKKSSTFAYHNHGIVEHLTITYESNRLHGRIARDNFGITKNIVIPDHLINLVYKNENINGYQSSNIISIIGFALEHLSNRNFTIWDSIAKNNLLERNVMGYYLKEDSGLVDFGFIDHKKYEGELVAHNLKAKDFWSLNLDEIRLDSKVVHSCKETKCSALIDTGASDLGFSKDIYDKFYKEVKSDIDCFNPDAFKELIFVIDGVEYSIDYKSIVLLWNKGDIRKCNHNLIVTHFKNHYEFNTVLIGEIFLKKYFAVFDKDNYQVHFAKRA